MDTCYVDDNCTKTGAIRRDMCAKHYQRWQKTGSPYTKTVRETLSAEQILVKRGWVVTPSGCWEAKGAPNGSGYKQIMFEGVRTSAHRIAYRAWIGEIPEGCVIRHKCDNPPCINPDHLEPGSQADNVQDMIVRGRSGIAKLTLEQVLEARALRENTSMTIQQIADKFGVTHSCMVAVVYRENWKHV